MPARSVFRSAIGAFLLIFMIPVMASAEGWGTGALMVIIEREKGSVVIADAAQNHRVLGRVGGLGVLNHASASFSRDGRYVYIVSRDGLLSKVDLVEVKLKSQVKVGESSIGLAVTQDNRHIAVSNYKPGNIVFVDDETFGVVKTIDADSSKTVGLADTPGNLLVVAMMDSNEMWIIDAGAKDFPIVIKYKDIGEKPYDAVLADSGRYYLVGYFHSDWATVLDLWNPEKLHKVALPKPEQKPGEAPPVLKIPHMRGWIMVDGKLFCPVIGYPGLAVISSATWKVEKTVDLAAYPVFAILHPDRRQIWINYAMGDFHDTVQVVDLKTMTVVKTLKPGNKIFHMAFSPKGTEIYMSANGDNKVLVYNTRTFEPIKEIPADRPSGIFSSERAGKFGM